MKYRVNASVTFFLSQGNPVVIKRVEKDQIDLTRTLLLELKQVSRPVLSVRRFTNVTDRISIIIMSILSRPLPVLACYLTVILIKLKFVHMKKNMAGIYVTTSSGVHVGVLSTKSSPKFYGQHVTFILLSRLALYIT